MEILRDDAHMTSFWPPEVFLSYTNVQVCFSNEFNSGNFFIFTIFSFIQTISNLNVKCYRPR